MFDTRARLIVCKHENVVIKNVVNHSTKNRDYFVAKYWKTESNDLREGAKLAMGNVI